LWQCYTGVFAGDGRTFKGAWQGLADGSRWKHDFDLNYLTAGQLARGRNWVRRRPDGSGG
jgi:hypothetical protein